MMQRYCLVLAFICSMSTALAQVPLNGLTAWYPFNGNAADISANGHNGTVIGAALTADRNGTPNSAYFFDGVNDEITLAGAFGGGTEFSVAAWINVYSYSTTWVYADDFQAIFEHSLYDSEFGVHFQVNTYGNNAVHFPAGGYLLLPIFQPQPLQQWRHVALTTKSGESKVYVDGQQLGGTDMTVYTIINQNNTYRIGSGDGQRYFHGVIDDVVVYSRALSQQEVLAIVQAPTLLPLVADAGPDQILTLGFGPQSITLSATANHGRPPYQYSWSDSQTGQVIQVSQLTTSTYTLTVTDADNRTATDQITVTVLDWRCGNGLDKVRVCHSNHEICISPEALQAHLAHGDIPGGCSVTKNNAPVSVRLSSPVIFPNPFNASASIVCHIPEEGNLRLSVFDCFGRMVMEKAEWAESSGTRTLSFDARNFPAGMYTCRLEWGGQIALSRMSLVK